jgi:hypothetical protein
MRRPGMGPVWRLAIPGTRVVLWRVQGFPRWAALAVAISQPLHFVAAVVVGSHGLDLVAWGLNAVGFAVVAITILRMSDEQWSPTYAPTENQNR